MGTQTHKDRAREGPAKSQPRKPDRAEPARDRDNRSEDVIDVHIGADEERATVEKRRREHQPPAEPGIPTGMGAADNPNGPIEITYMGDSGSIERDLGEADTAPHDIESDADPGAERNASAVDATNNLRRPRP